MSDDCCATCLGCGRDYCRCERASANPALCDDCYETEEDE